MKVLTDSKAAYDTDHALFLVQLYGFKEGQLRLYEKLRMYHMVIQHHIEARDSASIIKNCKKFGNSQPNLWVQVLTHFASRQDDCEEEIKQVLQYINRSSILPPLLVVQILAQNDRLPLSVVRDYIVGRLSKEHKLIAKDQVRARTRGKREREREREGEFG